MRKILLLIFVFSGVMLAQSGTVFPVLAETDFPDLTIEREEYYDGNSLWGLINGGADIYLEYGFDELAFQTIKWHDEDFRVEIYRMQSNESAYGIFSVSRFKCEINDTITSFICVTKYQLQAAVGKYYISIANTSGTNQAMDYTFQLFQKIFSMTNEQQLTLPELFRKETFIPFMDKLKFIKGDLGFMNSFPMWADKFSGYENFGVYILPIKNNTGYANIALVQFSGETDSERFIADNTSTDNFTILKLSDTEIEIIETNFGKSVIDKLMQ